MNVTTYRVWKILDYSKRNPASANTEYSLEPGTYELEKIMNPFGHQGFWLVVKGSTFGMAEHAWLQWEDVSEGSEFKMDFENKTT